MVGGISSTIGASPQSWVRRKKQKALQMRASAFHWSRSVVDMELSSAWMRSTLQMIWFALDTWVWYQFQSRVMFLLEPSCLLASRAMISAVLVPQ